MRPQPLEQHAVMIGETPVSPVDGDPRPAALDVPAERHSQLVFDAKRTEKLAVKPHAVELLRTQEIGDRVRGAVIVAQEMPGDRMLAHVGGPGGSQQTQLRRFGIDEHAEFAGRGIDLGVVALVSPDELPGDR
jgi:hypothetical protein